MDQQHIVVTLTLKIAQDRPTLIPPAEVLATVMQRLTGSPGSVLTVRSPVFDGMGWACTALTAKVEPEQPKKRGGAAGECA